MPDQKTKYGNINIIILTKENYLQFEIRELRFLDSYQFLSTSLEELVSLLQKAGKKHFAHTQKHLGTSDDLVFAKGVYPYSYMTEPKKFEETQLSPIKSFRDTLRGEDLKEDYQRAQETWSRFGCKTLKDYHDHYLKTDVLLLADVFEHFRWTTYASHRLDCLHFVTIPSLAWAMALKHTDAKLDLITDPQAYLMIENSMRGGIATINKRYACANNHLLVDFDPSKENKFITYLDANSLYVTAQCEPLPVGKFCFLSDEEAAKFDFETIAPDVPTG